MKDIVQLNNNIIRLLKDDIVFIIYLVTLIVVNVCNVKNKLALNKIPQFNNLLLLLICYFSFFLPKYSLPLILFYSHYHINTIKLEMKDKLLQLNKKLHEKKKEKFIPRPKTETKTKSKSESSCAVCKEFMVEPKFDSVANFAKENYNEKKPNIEKPAIGLRNEMRQNQRQPPR